MSREAHVRFWESARVRFPRATRLTKLRGPNRGEWYSLLVMLDIFSRMVVGWTLVRRADAMIAADFIEGTIAAHKIEPGTLTVHADRGAEMTAQLVGNLLDRLAVRRSHSRPHVSDDNPYSEAQFKTMKYAADFPDRFGCFEDALAHTRTFVTYYNTEHRHSGNRDVDACGGARWDRN
jgi:putative transposase